MRAGARTHLKPSSPCSSFVRKMAGSRAADCCGGGAPGSAAAAARGGAGAPPARADLGGLVQAAVRDALREATAGAGGAPGPAPDAARRPRRRRRASAPASPGALASEFEEALDRRLQERGLVQAAEGRLVMSERARGASSAHAVRPPRAREGGAWAAAASPAGASPGFSGRSRFRRGVMRGLGRVKNARGRRAGGARGLRAWQAVLEAEGPLDPLGLPPPETLADWGRRAGSPNRSRTASGGAAGTWVEERSERHYDDIRAKLGLPTHREQLAQARDAAAASAQELRDGRSRLEVASRAGPSRGEAPGLVPPRVQDALDRSFEGGAASLRRRYPELFRDLPPSAQGEAAAALHGAAAVEAPRRLAGPGAAAAGAGAPSPAPSTSPRPKTSRGRSRGGGRGEAPQVFSPRGP